MKKNRQIRQLHKVLDKVKLHRRKMESLTDEQLSGLTDAFKQRLENGKTLDDILPEAYAAICEADYRILKKRPYDVQILGAIAMHQGKLVEMNTGEGKTLVATMPLYLNALEGKGAFLLTSNEYLAIRDAEEMGPVYEFMGLKVAVGVTDKPDEKFTNDEKREIYNSDIVYTTHGILGFDYLLNNLVTSVEDRFMRELNYVIIDEADSVLLDSAQMPLVISGSPRVQSNLYEMADFFVTTLQEGRDYEKEDQKVWFTEEGIAYTEKYFRIDNFYGEEYFEINRHVTLALRAHVLFEKEKDYMLSKDHEIVLLDNGSGRMMPGVKLRGGQHQALEVKEGIEASRENRSVAAITYQNLFLEFPKMSGMSGTISDAKEEIREVYGIDVVVIPPNCPMKRVDRKDYFYVDRDSQFEAAISDAIKVHKTGQPVLIVVSTIAETELVSSLLIKENIAHSVLNANNAYWEAQIIKEAGKKNTVTVATAMAGRGTDIRLGDDVKELGGLAVIGIGRMANIRQERQARGRSGRQGDPGFSQFYVSLEDEVVRKYANFKTEKYIDGRKRISQSRLMNKINEAQKTSEEFGVFSRMQAMDYDQVIKRQRTLIYEMRDLVMEGNALNHRKIIAIAKDNIKTFLKSNRKLEIQDINRYVLDNISYQLGETLSVKMLGNEDAIFSYLIKLVKERLYQQEKKLGSEEQVERFIRLATLQAIDDAWVEEVDYLQQLQHAVAGRSSAQRKPVYEYQIEARLSFDKMKDIILKNIIRNILLSNVYITQDNDIRIILP